MTRPAPATLQDVLELLRARRDEVRERVGVELVGVVGSLARGDAKAESDVDVVFDPVRRFSYWDLGALLTELSEAFGRNVDLVDRQMMRPEGWSLMARDLVVLQ